MSTPSYYDTNSTIVYNNGKQIIQGFLLKNNMIIKKLTHSERNKIEKSQLNEMCDDEINCVLSDLLMEGVEDPNLDVYAIFYENKIISMSVIEMTDAGLYIDVSCTTPTRKRKRGCGGGVNYFIRAFAILDMLINNGYFEKIYGTMSGDLEYLTDYHTKKGCIIDGKNYSCNTFVYLNIFFNNIHSYKWTC